MPVIKRWCGRLLAVLAILLLNPAGLILLAMGIAAATGNLPE